jgi:hypothetical protein
MNYALGSYCSKSDLIGIARRAFRSGVCLPALTVTRTLDDLRDQLTYINSLKSDRLSVYKRIFIFLGSKGWHSTPFFLPFFSFLPVGRTGTGVTLRHWLQRTANTF